MHTPRLLLALVLALVLALATSRAFAAEHGTLLPMWEVTGEQNRVYLLGSVHLLRERDHPLPTAIYDAYDDAETLVMELDMDDIDPVATQALVNELGIIQDGKELQDLLGAEAYAVAEDVAAQLEVPLALLSTSEPWFAAITVEQLMLLRIGFNPTFGIEGHLTERARQDGKEIIGLESMREQLEFLDNLSLEAQRDLFMQTLTESREIESLMDDLIRAWRTGDTEFMEENLLREMAQFRELHRTIVVDRNVAWVDSIEQMLREEDDYLVVVGALHMVGVNGVPRLLSARGHAIEQLRGGD